MTEYTFPMVLRDFLFHAPADAYALTVPDGFGTPRSSVELPLARNFERFLRVEAAVDHEDRYLQVTEVNLTPEMDEDRYPYRHVLLDSRVTVVQALGLCREYREEHKDASYELPII